MKFAFSSITLLATTNAIQISKDGNDPASRFNDWSNKFNRQYKDQKERDSRFAEW